MDDGLALQALIQAAPGIRNGNYTFLAGIVFFLYDWAISLDKEVQHFWKRKRSIGGALYFANRYGYLLLMLIYYQATLRPLDEAEYHTVCAPLLYAMAVTNTVNTAVMQAVLTLRTYALWSCSQPVLYLLTFLNIGGFAVQIVIMALRLPTTLVIYNPLPAPYTGCVAVTGDWLYQRYIPILVFEITAAVLMVVKFVQYFRAGRASRVASVLFRDGFMEFTVVSTSSVFALFIERYQNPSDVLFTATLNIVPSLAVVCCARILLNIRDVMTITNYSQSSGVLRANPVFANGFIESNLQFATPGPSATEDNVASRHRARNLQLDNSDTEPGVESWELAVMSRG